MAITKPWVLGAGVYIALNFSSACWAETLAAKPSFSRTSIGFDALEAHTDATLTVVGPNGFAASVAIKGGLPSLDLAEFGAVADGEYAYQLSAATAEPDTSVVLLDNGRENNDRPRKGVALSGVFLVKGGAIVIPPAATEPASGSDQDRK